jgi:hypothetical protein
MPLDIPGQYHCYDPNIPQGVLSHAPLVQYRQYGEPMRPLAPVPIAPVPIPIPVPGQWDATGYLHPPMIPFVHIGHNPFEQHYGAYTGGYGGGPFATALPDPRFHPPHGGYHSYFQVSSMLASLKPYFFWFNYLTDICFSTQQPPNLHVPYPPVVPTQAQRPQNPHYLPPFIPTTRGDDDRWSDILESEPQVPFRADLRPWLGGIQAVDERDSSSPSAAIKPLQLRADAPEFVPKAEPMRQAPVDYNPDEAIDDGPVAGAGDDDDDDIFREHDKWGTKFKYF